MGAQSQTQAQSLPAAATAKAAPAASLADEQRHFDHLIETWAGAITHLPADSPLDADMLTRARALRAELHPLLLAAGLQWQKALAAAQPAAATSQLYLPLMGRLNNALVAWLVSSPGAGREAVEWRLAQHPTYCHRRTSLHGPQWALLAERLLFLQPLQGLDRDAAIQAERQRWQAWLAGPLNVPSSPSPAPQLQAFQAAERQRTEASTAQQGMVPWLSRRMLGEQAPTAYRDLTEACALMQWWLVNEVQRETLAPAEAMRLFRFGTLPASEYLLLMPSEVRQRARTAAAQAFPPIAQRFQVSGTTQTEVVLDAAGRALEVRIVGHQLSMPGLAADQRPLAFEQTMERAAFARLRNMRFDKPPEASLVDGKVRLQQELLWKLE